ncbi:peptidoglycan-binding domain-containing protein [Rhizobium deserti]|nr:peptidoglycan-binding domain-containing protein [Rhizobium deserti]
MRRTDAGRNQARRPGKGRSVKEPGLASRLLMAAGSTAARHPKPLFGFAGFAVLFSFVAANALWYQPNGHPSPFLATRDPDDPNRIAGYRPLKRTAPADVTTFRIERAPEPPPPALAQPSQSADDAPALPQTHHAVPQPAVPQPEQAAAVAPAHDAAVPAQVAAPLPKPAMPQTARSQPQKSVQPQSGQVQRNPAAAGQNASAHPASAQPTKGPAGNRPAENVSMRAEDPIAAAIRSAERNPAMTPPADIPGTGWKNTTAAANAGPARSQASVPASNMVLQIQKGLANIAYTDVEVDGVAGSQTKAAIRRFEKHYRLPETGEPNDMVLKKLKAIGAL